MEIVAHNRTARVLPEKAGGEMEGEIEVEVEVEVEDRKTTFGPWKNNWPVSA